MKLRLIAVSHTSVMTKVAGVYETANNRNTWHSSYSRFISLFHSFLYQYKHDKIPFKCIKEEKGKIES
jgi:hypothetical protein